MRYCASRGVPCVLEATEMGSTIPTMFDAEAVPSVFARNVSRCVAPLRSVRRRDSQSIFHPFHDRFSLSGARRAANSSPSPPRFPSPDLSHQTTPEIAIRVQLGDLSAELEKKYASAHPDLCSLREALHVPGIIHSTVMRLAAAPSDAGRLAEGLTGLAAQWEPATVRVSRISMINERRPYMHLSPDGAEAHCYSLPFC